MLKSWSVYLLEVDDFGRKCLGASTGASSVLASRFVCFRKEHIDVRIGMHAIYALYAIRPIHIYPQVSAARAGGKRETFRAWPRFFHGET